MERERRVAELATRQHGVLSRRQLLTVGLTARMIERRIRSGRLHLLHRGVYALGHERLTQRARWMAAVLACGPGAVLSHRSAAALWGLAGSRGPIHVTGRTCRRRRGVQVHCGRLVADEREVVDGIPVTSVARTLLDVAEALDGATLERVFEEADRLGYLSIPGLEEACARNPGRRGLRPLRPLIEAARQPAVTRSALEERFAAFCAQHQLPAPAVNVSVLGSEVDALWPRQRVIVELDGFAYHGHRGAFERDRARDAARQAAGYRVVRLTHRRLVGEPAVVAAELRRLLAADGQRGQGTVEWVALLLVVALLFAGLVAAGLRLPGASLAEAVASKIACAAALADSCGDEVDLITAYGGEVGGLVRRSMPAIVFEPGSRAVPVDFRRCRSTACANGPERGRVSRSDAGNRVTAFVHVIDCRPDAAPVAAACSGERAGNLYIQYWFYYPDSATLRGVPVVGRRGYHRDDWESLQVRIEPDGTALQRASSHNGYNHTRGVANAGSDAGVPVLRDVAEALGARPRNGWGPAGTALVVSGGSHAGNIGVLYRPVRHTPGPSVHLVPLEPTAAADRHRFAVSAPWEKRVWRDPEAQGTS